jgi:hypothetical protein
LRRREGQGKLEKLSLTDAEAATETEKSADRLYPSEMLASKEGNGQCDRKIWEPRRPLESAIRDDGSGSAESTRREDIDRLEEEATEPDQVTSGDRTNEPERRKSTDVSNPRERHKLDESPNSSDDAGNCSDNFWPDGVGWPDVQKDSERMMSLSNETATDGWTVADTGTSADDDTHSGRDI